MGKGEGRGASGWGEGLMASTLMANRREKGNSLHSLNSWPTKAGCVYWPRCVMSEQKGESKKGGGWQGCQFGSLLSGHAPTIVYVLETIFPNMWRSEVVCY